MSKWLASCLLGSKYHDTDYILKLDESHETVCKECNQNYVELRKDEWGDFGEAIFSSKKQAIEYMNDNGRWFCNGCDTWWSEDSVDKKAHDCESLDKPRNTKKRRIQRKKDIESKIEQLKSELKEIKA